MIDKEATRKWGYSLWIRFFGIIVWTIFIAFTLIAEDVWIDALIQGCLVILTFILIIVLPDKLMLGERLVDKSKSARRKR